MYIPEEIGNKHIRVFFSFDQPEQNSVDACELSFEEIKNWISECVGGMIVGGSGHFIVSADKSTICCETEINIQFAKNCDRCGQQLQVSIHGTTSLQYLPESHMYKSTPSTTKKSSAKKKNIAKGYVDNSDGVALTEEDLEMGFYPPTGVSSQQILSEMILLIMPSTIRCQDTITDGNKDNCNIPNDEKDVFTNNLFANFPNL